MTIRNLIDELRAQGEVVGYDADVEIDGIKNIYVKCGTRSLKIADSGISTHWKAIGEISNSINLLHVLINKIERFTDIEIENGDIETAIDAIEKVQHLSVEALESIESIIEDVSGLLKLR